MTISQNLARLFCAIYTGSALPLFCLPWVAWSRCRLSFQNRRFVTAVMRTDVTLNTSRASAFPVRAHNAVCPRLTASNVLGIRSPAIGGTTVTHVFICCVQVSSEFFGNSRLRSRNFCRSCYLCVSLAQADVPFPIPYSALLLCSSHM